MTDWSEALEDEALEGLHAELDKNELNAVFISVAASAKRIADELVHIRKLLEIKWEVEINRYDHAHGVRK